MSSTRASQVDRTLKCLLLGEANVGKTAIANRYSKGEFDARRDPTIGVEFYQRRQRLPNGECVQVQVWDTAGEEKYRALSAPVFRGAHMAVIVYDITSRRSFDNVPFWLGELQRHAAASCVIAIVGNKLDLEYLRSVDSREADEIARTIGASFIEVSAKDAVNVDKLFDVVVGLAAERLDPREVPTVSPPPPAVVPTNETPDAPRRRSSVAQLKPQPRQPTSTAPDEQDDHRPPATKPESRIGRCC